MFEILKSQNLIEKTDDAIGRHPVYKSLTNFINLRRYQFAEEACNLECSLIIRCFHDIFGHKIEEDPVFHLLPIELDALWILFKDIEFENEMKIHSLYGIYKANQTRFLRRCMEMAFTPKVLQPYTTRHKCYSWQSIIKCCRDLEKERAITMNYLRTTFPEENEQECISLTIAGFLPRFYSLEDLYSVWGEFRKESEGIKFSKL